MSNFQIADQPGLCQLVSLAGTDDTGTDRGLKNVIVTLADSTNAYIADAGPNGGGYPQFYIVPRQNVPGGTPLASPVTVSVSITANDPVLGGALTPLLLTADLLVQAPPPPHTTNLGVQGSTAPVTPSTIPPDPGVTTITLSLG
jgi:hypothetical protein